MQRAFFIALLLCGVIANAEIGANIDVALSPKGSFTGKTNEVTGFATLSGDMVKAENIVVKLKNIKTGLALRDKHMTEKYLETAKHPEAVLLSASGQNGKGKGRIKIRGVEKDIEGTYKVSGDELTADFPLKMSDFGITGVKYMGIGANDDLKIHVTVPVKKTASTASPAAKKKK